MKYSHYLCSDLSLLFVLLHSTTFVLDTTTAFVDTIAHSRVCHPINTIHSSSSNDDLFFGKRATDGEVRQDAYGRTIQRNQNEEDSAVDPQTTTTTQQGSSSQNINLDPLVVCGPSGVGKGTVIECLRNRFPENVFGFSVSHTTRQPRPGEIHGEHYYFTAQDDIQRDIDQGLFVEHALVHGNYYGTSKEAIEVLQSENKITILDIDMQGVISVKESGVPARYVFIAPPSMIELENRLRGRGTETEEAIQRRLGNAAKEIEYGEQDGAFDRIFVNNDVENTVDEMVEVLKEWYPQLKEAQDHAQDSSVKAEGNNKQATASEDTTTATSTTSQEPSTGSKEYDIMATSDKLLNLPSVQMGHNRLEVTDRSSEQQDPQKNNEKNYVSYYTVDNEESESSSSFRNFGNTNPNIVLDDGILDNANEKENESETNEDDVANNNDGSKRNYFEVSPDQKL